ncbi:MAG: copper chaperone PCu(A)C, partial [Rhizobiales bacterium]|nr:copper chaperone PCu(A)C [Hyphomicrobiales bacterium]
MKGTVLAAVALGVSAIALSSCGQKAPEKTDVSPNALPGISITDGKLVLPAVKGNPAAVYFNITYSGDDVAMIRAVDVKGAKSAMLHDTVKSGGMTSMNEMP